MTDRVPLYPGRVTLTPVSGQTNTYDMARADQPTQEGTPLNKGTLLSDETAAALNLTQDNPTVDNALARLSGGVVSVGDIKTTARADLDDNWLLCNGAQLSESEYPELYAMLSSKLSGIFFTNKDVWSSSDEYSVINCITYANGYWVVGGHYYKNDTGFCARIAYATSLDGPWTTKDLWSGKDYRTTLNDITYANGYWVAVGRGYTSYFTAQLAYATTLTGTWTTKTMWSASSGRDASAYCVAYGNGYWVVGGRDEYSSNSCKARINYATSLDGTWEYHYVWSDHGYSSAVYDVAYGNGYWVAVGDCPSGSQSSTGAYMAYSTDISGTWTSKSLSEGTLYCIIYVNGKWIAGGVNYDYAHTVENGAIYYCDTPDGVWESNKIADGSVRCIAYADGNYVAGIEHNAGFNYCELAYCTSLSGTWGTRILWSGSENSRADGINNLVYADEKWAVGGQFYDGSASSGRIAFANGAMLPTASGDFYTYIRAKEVGL